MIKSEVGGGTELHENVEEEPIEETQILVDNLKFEPNSGEFFLKRFLFCFGMKIEILKLFYFQRP